MKALLLVSAVVLAGCRVIASSPLETADNQTPAPVFEGMYVVDSAAGQALPAVLLQTPDPVSNQTIEVYLIADTLLLQTDGTYIQRGRLEIRIGGIFTGRQIWSDHGLYTRNGTHTTFDSGYLQNVFFSAEQRADGRLLVTQDLTREASPALHVFVPVNR